MYDSTFGSFMLQEHETNKWRYCDLYLNIPQSLCVEGLVPRSWLLEPVGDGASGKKFTEIGHWKYVFEVDRASGHHHTLSSPCLPLLPSSSISPFSPSLIFLGSTFFSSPLLLPLMLSLTLPSLSFSHSLPSYHPMKNVASPFTPHLDPRLHWPLNSGSNQPQTQTFAAMKEKNLLLLLTLLSQACHHSDREQTWNPWDHLFL